MLGWFAETTVVAAALAALVVLTSRFGRLGPEARHALWLVVLLKLACPPVVAWPWSVPRWPVVVAARESPVFEERKMGQEVGRPLALDPATAEAVVFRPWRAPIALPRSEKVVGASWKETILGNLLVAWLVGTAVVVARRVGRIARFRRSLAQGRPAPDWLVAEAGAIGARLGVRPPPVLAVPVDGSPLLWCLGRPRLVVSDRLVARLAADRWPVILAHELAHLVRRDHWVVRLELVAEAVWWWNPLFWLICRRLRAEAEQACDARVLRALPGRRFAYAEALVEVCEHLSRPSIAPPALGVGGGAGASRLLEARLLMILGEPVPPRPGPRVALAVATLAALALPTWSLAQEPPEPPKVEAPAKPETSVPEPGPAPQGAAAGLAPATDPTRAPSRPASPSDVEEMAELRLQIHVAKAKLNQASRATRDPEDPAIVSARRQLDRLEAQYRTAESHRQDFQAAADEAQLMRHRRESKAAEVKKAEAQLKLARSVIQRNEQRKRSAPDMVSNEDALQAETELKVAEADLDGKKAELAEADLRLEQARRGLAPRAADRLERDEASREAKDALIARGQQTIATYAAAVLQAQKDDGGRDNAAKLENARRAALAGRQVAEADSARLRPEAVGPPTLADLRDIVELMEVQLEGKQADLRGAEASRALDGVNLLYTKKLREKASVSAQEVEIYESRDQIGAATLDRKKADVREAEVRLKQARRRVDAEEARLKRAIDRAKADLERLESLREQRIIGEHAVTSARQLLEDLKAQAEAPR